MIYLDIELLPQPPVPGLGPIIQICPHGNNDHARGFFEIARFFPGRSLEYFELRYQEFHRDIVDWVLRSCPDFDPAAVHFCTDHLVRHALCQYICAFDIAVEIARKHPIATVLCRDTLLAIQSDWNSPIINLLGVLNGYASLGLDLQIAELNPGVLSSLFRNGLEYIPVGVLYRPLATDPVRGNFFTQVITESDYLRYTLTGRHAEAISDIEGQVLNLLPKSSEVGPGFVGVANQFGGVEPIELDVTWSPSLEKRVDNALAQRIEAVFFESIGRQVLGRMTVLEPRFHRAFADAGRLPGLIAEETVDIESLALFSALKRHGAEVRVTQHSYNPLPRSLYSERQGRMTIFPTRILASQQLAADIYRECFGDQVLVEEHLAVPAVLDAEQMPSAVMAARRRILLIENDFIRAFGVSVNLERLLSEVMTFIGAAQALGFCDFVWRQRTLKNTVFIDAVKRAFPDARIDCDAQRSLPELVADCFAAVGFGSNSSFALQYICHGGIYFFASVLEQSYEYLPSHDFIGQETGSIRSAARLFELADDTAAYQTHWSEQRLTVAREYGI